MEVSHLLFRFVIFRCTLAILTVNVFDVKFSMFHAIRVVWDAKFTPLLHTMSHGSKTFNVR